jgi:hypothetical protein
MSMIDRLAAAYLADPRSFARTASEQAPAPKREIRLPDKWMGWHGGLNIHAFVRDQKYDSKVVSCSKTDVEYVTDLASKCSNDDYAVVSKASNKIRDFKRAYRYGVAAEDEGHHRVAQMFFERCRNLIMSALEESPDTFTYPKGYHPTKTSLEIHRDSYPHTHSELTHFVTAQSEADVVASEDLRKTFLSRADLSAAERRRVRQMSAAEFNRLVEDIKAEAQSKTARGPSWLDLLQTRYSKDELAPESKDRRRVEDMSVKAKGSNEKMLQLARNMAKAITDAAKAYRRARAAESANYHDIAEIFDARAQAIVDLW